MTYAAACLLAFLPFSIGPLKATDLLRHESSPVSFEQMAKVSLFAFGGVGFASVTSEGEIGFNEMISRSTSAAEFEKLFAVGNPQAKSYALVALRRLNPERFESLAMALQSSKMIVSTAHGCVLFREPITAIVTQIRAGAYSGHSTVQNKASTSTK